MAEWNNTGKAPLPNFRDWVPDRARVFLYVVFLCTFQFTNGMYFTAFPQMQGELSITSRDVAMMGQAVLVGLTFYFPLAFRFKLRFPNKWNLLAAAGIQLLCNLVFPHLDSMPARIAICYLGGFCRLCGTFECLSNLLPRITPTYNYAVFLSFVFFVVLAFINIFDMISTQIIYYFGWTFIHVASAGLLLVAMALMLAFMKSFRPGPPKPLYGINWTGMATWSIFLLAVIFIASYGEQLDWWHSDYIKAASGIASLCLAYGIWAMYGLRHPFINREAFSMKYFWRILGVFLVLDIMLAAQTVLQSTYCTVFLGLDILANANLKWLDFIGQAAGALFCYIAMTKWHVGARRLTFIAFCAITLYMAGMYAVATPYTTVEKLYLPLVLCGFGHVIIFIALTAYVQANANFTYYFQMICLLGFIRTGAGGPVGDALLERGMTALSGYNGLLCTIRELYGAEMLIGIAMLCMILLSYISGKARWRQGIPQVQDV